MISARTFPGCHIICTMDTFLSDNTLWLRTTKVYSDVSEGNYMQGSLYFFIYMGGNPMCITGQYRICPRLFTFIYWINLQPDSIKGLQPAQSDYFTDGERKLSSTTTCRKRWCWRKSVESLQYLLPFNA